MSTEGQECDRQYEVLEKLGITKENTVTDKASGKDFDRPGFQKLMGLLEPGDLVVCKSLDRLGRDVREVQKVINEITCVKEAGERLC